MAIDLDYIQNLAGSHEGVDVEFKETTGQLDRGMETLCGMLNGEGGIFNTEKRPKSDYYRYFLLKWETIG